MPSFSAAQQTEQLVAARLGLEFLLLVEGEFLLETFLALVESGHFFGSNPGQMVNGGRVVAARSHYLDRGGKSVKQRAVKPQGNRV